MKILKDSISLDEFKKMTDLFGDMVKAVVDTDREIIAVDAELHSDLEALLLENGSNQKNVWGVNIYPELSGDDFVEFDLMINMKPSQGNKTRGVDDGLIREHILKIVDKRIKR